MSTTNNELAQYSSAGGEKRRGRRGRGGWPTVPKHSNPMQCLSMSEAK